MESAKELQGRILLVDDESAILRTFRYCLEDEGYNVATANSAARNPLSFTTPQHARCVLACRGTCAGELLCPRVWTVDRAQCSAGQLRAFESPKRWSGASPWEPGHVCRFPQRSFFSGLD